jgi:hypothetical protein
MDVTFAAPITACAKILGLFLEPFGGFEFPAIHGAGNISKTVHERATSRKTVAAR